MTRGLTNGRFNGFLGTAGQFPSIQATQSSVPKHPDVSKFSSHASDAFHCHDFDVICQFTSLLIIFQAHATSFVARNRFVATQTCCFRAVFVLNTFHRFCDLCVCVCAESSSDRRATRLNARRGKHAVALSTTTHTLGGSRAQTRFVERSVSISFFLHRRF